MDKEIVIELKKAILQSRYQATRLVNKELILLYLKIGETIINAAQKEAWGSKVLDQISDNLQAELPGLRGFSSGNLKKMRAFADFWRPHFPIGSTLPNQLENSTVAISSATILLNI